MAFRRATDRRITRHFPDFSDIHCHQDHVEPKPGSSHRGFYARVTPTNHHDIAGKQLCAFRSPDKPLQTHHLPPWKPVAVNRVKIARNDQCR
jgi:hypothetical protein